MSEDIRKKMMVDLKKGKTIAELLAAMQTEDEADAVRPEIEEEVKVASTKMEEDEEEDKAAKSAVALVADLVKKQAAESRRRVAAATPVVTAPSYKGNPKHLKDSKTAYGLGQFMFGAMGNTSVQQWVSDRYGAKAHI